LIPEINFVIQIPDQCTKHGSVHPLETSMASRRSNFFKPQSPQVIDVLSVDRRMTATRAIEAGPLPREPGTIASRQFARIPCIKENAVKPSAQKCKHARLKLSNIKRNGIAPSAGRVSLHKSSPAIAVDVDCESASSKNSLSPTPSSNSFPTAGISTIPYSSGRSPSRAK
jgi:hypothetical protein